MMARRAQPDASSQKAPGLNVNNLRLRNLIGLDILALYLWCEMVWACWLEFHNTNVSRAWAWWFRFGLVSAVGWMCQQHIGAPVVLVLGGGSGTKVVAVPFPLSNTRRYAAMATVFGRFHPLTSLWATPAFYIDVTLLNSPFSLSGRLGYRSLYCAKSRTDMSFEAAWSYWECLILVRCELHSHMMKAKLYLMARLT